MNEYCSEISELILVSPNQVVIIVPIYRGGGPGSQRLRDLFINVLWLMKHQSQDWNHLWAFQARRLTSALCCLPGLETCWQTDGPLQDPLSSKETSIQHPLEICQEQSLKPIHFPASYKSPAEKLVWAGPCPQPSHDFLPSPKMAE